MSDKILRALMQLFAIVANTDLVGIKGREIVERFLSRQINAALVTQYLDVYDSFLENLKGKSEEGKTKKRASVNSVKVLKICTEINKELEQKQKVIVLIRLLEFVHTAVGMIADDHLEFIKTVSDTFIINETDYNNCHQLVFSSDEHKVSGMDFLVVDKASTGGESHRHIKRENLSGNLIFLLVNNPQFFLVKYHGSDQLFLDGRAIIPDSVNVFDTGSVIRSTKMNAVYYNDVIHNYLELSVEQKITFKTTGLEYEFNRNKIGLHELNFVTNSKNLVAVMGNSGAGKTTLLNLLNGTTTPTKGSILVNGINLRENKSLLRGLIGNIPQDDLLVEELSVFQNLFYSSKLYFGGLSDEEITKKVDECLNTLGLYEIKDLLVGDPLNKFISGGQRKRLNIALELIREPEILFVDEPTSGLSSNDAENVMDLLKQLTLAGKLIFVVIHQPSSEIFKLFDQLLLLDKGGYPIYFGNPVDSVRYFKKQMNYVDYENSECSECGNINPEEIFRIVESKTVDEFGKATGNRKITSTEWYKLYNSNFGVNKTDEKIVDKPIVNSVNVSNPFVQFWVYFQRNLFSKLNNQQYLVITLIEGPLLALILSIALRSTAIGKEYRFGTNMNIPVYLFISTIVALFLGLIVSADEIIQDKRILKRESFLRLNRSSYLFSKITFLFLVSAIQTFLFLMIGNLILGIKNMFLDYWVVLFSVSCFANLLGLNISSGMKTRIAVYILIPFLVIPQIMLSGVMVKFEDLGPMMRSRSKVPLVGNVMAARWAYEGLAVDQFKNNDYEKLYFEADEQIYNSKYRKDFWVQKMQEQQKLAENLLMRANVSIDSLSMLSDFFKNEFRKFSIEYPYVVCKPLDKLELGKDKQAFMEVVKSNLEGIEQQMIKICNDGNARCDKITEKLNKEMGVDNALEFKNRYQNEQLQSFVTNDMTRNYCLLTENSIIRKYYPVYHKSVSMGLFSAPLYSYSKSLLGWQIPTVWFNVIIIWLMTLVLYATLYYDLLQKLLKRR